MRTQGNDVTRVASLRRQLTILGKKNAALSNAIEVRNQQMQNSLFSLVQGAQNQTALGSFSNLAYYNIYAPLTINWTLLTYMYKTHGIIQTAIDMPVLDAMRGGLEITSDELSPDDIKDLQDHLENSGILSTVCEAQTWTRLYGGGGLILNTPQDPESPLKDGQMKNVEFYAANRWELVAPNRFAEFYDFYGQKVHKSRVLTMSGKPAPYIVRWTLQGWGMSEVERMIEDFNAYLRTKDVIYELLKEAKIDVYQFENFTAQLATSAGTQLTQTRVQLMNQIKSYQNAVVLDAKDKFEQKQITFAGLAEVMKQNMIGIASALRIPMAKLFGLSASGFNSGEDDIENYNAMIESEVRTPLRPVIRKVLDLACLQLFGQTFDIGFRYKPLRVMSSVDEENVNTQKHNRYKSLYDSGLLTSVEVMGLMQSEKLVPIETEVGSGAEPEPPQVMAGGEGEEMDADEPTGTGKESSKPKSEKEPEAKENE